MKYPENIKTPANKSLTSSQIIRISISRLNSYTNVFNQQDWESTHIHSITNICFMRFMHKMCSQKPQTQLSPSSTQDPDISRNQNSQNLTDLMQFLTQTALTVHCKPNSPVGHDTRISPQSKSLSGTILRRKNTERGATGRRRLE